MCRLRFSEDPDPRETRHDVVSDILEADRRFRAGKGRFRGNAELGSVVAVLRMAGGRRDSDGPRSGTAGRSGETPRHSSYSSRRPAAISARMIALTAAEILISTATIGMAEVVTAPGGRSTHPRGSAPRSVWGMTLRPAALLCSARRVSRCRVASLIGTLGCCTQLASVGRPGRRPCPGSRRASMAATMWASQIRFFQRGPGPVGHRGARGVEAAARDQKARAVLPARWTGATSATPIGIGCWRVRWISIECRRRIGSGSSARPEARTDGSLTTSGCPPWGATSGSRATMEGRPERCPRNAMRPDKLLLRIFSNP